MKFGYVAGATLAVLALTAVHHLYGAWRFDTPWRAHVAHIAAIFAALLLLAVQLVRSVRSPLWSRIGMGLLVFVSCGVAALWLGAFEGMYNHVLKDALYVSGIAPERWRTLYPSSLYEPPGDWFFEFTGMLQAPLGLLAGWWGWRLFSDGSGAKGD